MAEHVRCARLYWSHCFTGSVDTDLLLFVDPVARTIVKGRTTNGTALEPYQLADVAESLFADYNRECYLDALETAELVDLPAL